MCSFVCVSHNRWELPVQLPCEPKSTLQISPSSCPSAHLVSTKPEAVAETYPVILPATTPSNPQVSSFSQTSGSNYVAAANSVYAICTTRPRQETLKALHQQELMLHQDNGVDNSSGSNTARSAIDFSSLSSSATVSGPSNEPCDYQRNTSSKDNVSSVPEPTDENIISSAISIPDDSLSSTNSCYPRNKDKAIAVPSCTPQYLNMDSESGSKGAPNRGTVKFSPQIAVESKECSVANPVARRKSINMPRCFSDASVKYFEETSTVNRHENEHVSLSRCVSDVMIKGLRKLTRHHSELSRRCSEVLTPPHHHDTALCDVTPKCPRKRKEHVEDGRSIDEHDAKISRYITTVVVVVVRVYSIPAL